MKKLFCTMLATAVLCSSMELPMIANAAEIIDSGTIEDIDWTLDAEGTLSLSIDEWPSELPTDAFVQDGRIVTVRLGEDVSVADSAFRDCENLTAVYIAEGGLADVSTYAFNDCDALRMSEEQKYDGYLEMTIKENHKTTYQIGEEFDESSLSLWGGGTILYRNVFMNPDGTESQTDWTVQGNWDCFGEKPTSIDSSEFDSSKPGKYPIYGYLSSPNLCDLYGVVMVEVVDGEGAEKVSCGENCYYTLDEDGTLTFGGVGAIDVGPDPSYDREKVKKIVIGKGITSVSRGAFWYLENLESITVQNEDMKFEEITDQYANPFEGCTKLHMETVESRTGSVEFSAGNAKIYYNIGEEFDPTGFTLSGCGAMCISFRYTDDNGKLVYETKPFAYGNWDLFPKGSYTKMTFDTSEFNSLMPSECEISISYNDPTTSETVVKKVKVYVAMGESIPCGENAIAKLAADGTLTISGTGVAAGVEAGKSDDGEMSRLKRQYVKKVVVSEGITGLDEYLFQDCVNLTEVTLPSTLTSIGTCVFAGTDSLKSIVIPEGVTILENNVFYGSGLKSVTLPSKLKSIGNYAFTSTDLTEIQIPETVTEIGAGAFQNTKFQTIQLPKNLTRIEEDLFEGAALTEFTIPENIQTIGEKAFAGTKIREITVPKNVTEIEANAFASESIKKIVLENPDCKLGTNEHEEGIHAWSPALVFAKPGSAAETAAKKQGLSVADISKADMTIGDANGDGTLDISDIILFARVAAEDTSVSLDEDGKLATDVNRDGKYNAEDTSIMLRMIAKLE